MRHISLPFSPVAAGYTLKLCLIWRHDNHPIELFSNEVTKQKLDYVDLNPVRTGFIAKPEDWIYSSASNYAGMSGLLDVRLLF